MKNEKVTHTPGPIDDYFQLSYLIGETLTSEVHRAVKRDDTRPVSIWMSKFGYNLESQEAHDLIKHMHSLDEIEPPISLIEMYGIDSNGVGFVCLSDSLLNDIGKQRGSAAEMARRFFKVVRLIHKAHEKGAIFGDLNTNSFWLGNTGEVEFSGVLQLFRDFPADALKKVPAEIAEYIAPEVMHKRPVDSRTDVYSLGMIGYKLFCDNFPVDLSFDLEHQPVLAKRQNFDIPADISEDVLAVLRKATAENPQDRYASASELLEALVSVNEKEGKGDKVKKRNSSDTNLPAIKKPGEIAKSEAAASKTTKASHKVFFVSLLVLALVAAGLIFFFNHRYKEQLAQEIGEATAQYSGGNPELSKAAARFADISAEDSEKIKEINSLSQSSDPLAYSVLIASANSANSKPVAFALEAAIIKRLNANKLKRAAIQLQQWLRYSKKTPADPIYQSVLKALDPIMPIAKRNKALLKVGQQDLNIATRLATALYFDLDSSEIIQAVLFKQVGEKFKIDNAENLSALALILHHEALSQIFTEDIQNHLKNLSKEDVDSLLLALAKRNDANIISVVDLALQKDFYGDKGKYFLQPIKNSPEVKADIKSSLVLALHDQLTTEDLKPLLYWEGEAAEKVLYMICRYVQDDRVKVAALDNLSAKGSINLQPGAGIIQWLKEHNWASRSRYVNAIAVLVTSNSADEQEIKAALDTFGEKLEQKDLRAVILASEDEKVPEIFVKYYANQIDLAEKLNLLYHKSKVVRAEVIPTIDTNDVGAMQLIVAAYEQENNQELKKQYQKLFWFIKGR